MAAMLFGRSALNARTLFSQSANNILRCSHSRLYSFIINTYGCEDDKSPCGKMVNLCDAETVRKMRCEFKVPLRENAVDLCHQRYLAANPKCCNNPCPDYNARCDDLCYKPTGMNRCFRQTWVECPNLVRQPRKICCMGEVIPPQFERRPMKPKCDQIFTSVDMLMLMCRMGAYSKCPKVTVPCCRRARNPPRCKKGRSPSNCKKHTTQYPSYSECKRPKPRPRRAVECNCLVVGPLCHH